MSVRGIDVSDYQPNVNWRTVADSGMAFAVVKATEGRTFVAETFASNWQAIKATGMVRGAYHFFRPKTDPKEQADNFLRTVKLEPGDLPAVFDIETLDGVPVTEIREKMIIWLDIVEKATGMLPIIYTYPGFWQQLGTNGFTKHPLWIAHYTTAPAPIIPGGWKSWVFWQYTDNGPVNGIAGGVDVNLYENVTEGTKGVKAEYIQTLLKAKGFDPGPIDGNFGANSKTALINFQKAHQLKTHGIADVKTWVSLVSPTPQNATPTPTPTPTPTVNPEVPSKPPIRLVDACSNYHGLPNEDGAFNWLQDEISPAIMAEFAQKWRNQPPNPEATIRLTEVARYHRGNTTQVNALDWLQQQIEPEILTEFALRWEGYIIPSIPSLRLRNFAKMYAGTTGQDQALQWLKKQMPPLILAEFAQNWRKQPPNQNATINLIDTFKFYRGLPSQDIALDVLQKKLPETTITDFAQRWNISSAVPPINLIDITRFYQGKPGQKAALQWLQSQLDQKTLAEFAQRWRKP